MTIKNLAVYQALEGLAEKSLSAGVVREMYEERLRDLAYAKESALKVALEELSKEQIDELLQAPPIEHYGTAIRLHLDSQGGLAVDVQELRRGMDLRELNPEF